MTIDESAAPTGATAPSPAPGPPIRVVVWQWGGTRVEGGHRIQFDETARALRALGVSAEVVNGPDYEPDGVDLVHGLGLPAEEVHRLRSAGLPVVLSTIYWDVAVADAWEHPLTVRTVLGRCRRALVFGRAALRGVAPLTESAIVQTRAIHRQAAAFEAADLLLPNAEGETASIRRELGVTTPAMVVPNAVDPDRFDQDGLPGGERDIVLSVGRIDPQKNTLGLIDALKGSGRPLVLVGADHPDHPAYSRACRQAGRGWVEFVGPKPPDELRQYYARARVHVLAGWFETTGLVSLEAALGGCSLVSTDRGHAHEYLGGHARYCDPADPASIRRAVDDAWSAAPGPDMRRRVLDHYTWSHAAAATAEAYRSVLAGRRTAGA